MSLPPVKHSLEPVISTALISGSLSAYFSASAKWLYMEWRRSWQVSRLKSQRSTTGQEHIGQQLIARQSRQVQTPGKGVDTVGASAE